MKRPLTFIALTALAVTATPALAQNSTTQQEIFGTILGALFGDRGGDTTSIEAQWAAGRTPLSDQRPQFDSRIDSEVSAGTMTRATGARLKTDYAALVQLETRYGADRRFTSAERTELANRYGTLTQVLADRGYSDGATATTEVADSRAAFDARVNAAVAARRITRTQGTRLKSDYGSVIQVEAGYLNDGVITVAERADLDARLDALDIRVGDTAVAVMTPRARLDAIGRALSTIRLSRTARAQLQVEYEDISRLEQAYARMAASTEERTYLDRRVAELETRAGIRTAVSGF